MSAGPFARLLPGGERLHLQHGPIDLIIGADGAREAAFAAATERFKTILAELVEELPALRAPAQNPPRAFKGKVAQRMEAVTAPLTPFGFITPMAAVAGAVAQEILGAMTKAADLTRAYVNNGGDIALYLATGARFDIAIARLAGPGELGRVLLTAQDKVRGIATSGLGGRSFTLGIAEAVTVLAKSAAAADAAATVIANAVNLPGHPAIRRQRADEIQPDSDLGARLVTLSLGHLSKSEVSEALDAGQVQAKALLAQGLIEGAALFLRGDSRLVGGSQSAMLLAKGESRDA